MTSERPEETISDLTIHLGVAERIAAGFYLPGSDRDDVRQEALIGLWRGLQRFDGRGDLQGYLGMAVRRHLVNKLRDARAEKHQVLNVSARHGVLELLPGHADPHDQLVQKERLGAVVQAVQGMPVAHRRAVAYAVNGWPYAGDKSIDNALQRARRKLSLLSEGAG